MRSSPVRGWRISSSRGTPLPGIGAGAGGTGTDGMSADGAVLRMIVSGHRGGPLRWRPRSRRTRERAERRPQGQQERGRQKRRRNQKSRMNRRINRIPENRMHQVSTIYSGRMLRVNPYLWWIIWCIGNDEYPCFGAVLIRFSSACHLVVRWKIGNCTAIRRHAPGSGFPGAWRRPAANTREQDRCGCTGWIIRAAAPRSDRAVPRAVPAHSRTPRRSRPRTRRRGR